MCWPQILILSRPLCFIFGLGYVKLSSILITTSPPSRMQMLIQVLWHRPTVLLDSFVPHIITAFGLELLSSVWLSMSSGVLVVFLLITDRLDMTWVTQWHMPFLAFVNCVNMELPTEHLSAPLTDLEPIIKLWSPHLPDLHWRWKDKRVKLCRPIP